MVGPVVSKLWIAAAEHTLEEELGAARPETIADVRSRLRVAAVTAEDLMNLIAGPRSAARSTVVAALLERFGDRAVEVDFVGAAFIEEAVDAALVESGVNGAEASRIAGRCHDAVIRAAQAIDTLGPLLVD